MSLLRNPQLQSVPCYRSSRKGISSEVSFRCIKQKAADSVTRLIRPTESAALSWGFCMLCVCAWKDLTVFLRQNGLRFPPPPSAATCISPDFFPGGNIHSELEFLHNFGSSKARNLCPEKKSRAQEAPFYGPFELSLLPKKRYWTPVC